MNTEVRRLSATAIRSQHVFLSALLFLCLAGCSGTRPAPHKSADQRVPETAVTTTAGVGSDTAGIATAGSPSNSVTSTGAKPTAIYFDFDSYDVK